MTLNQNHATCAAIACAAILQASLLFGQAATGWVSDRIAGLETQGGLFQAVELLGPADASAQQRAALDAAVRSCSLLRLRHDRVAALLNDPLPFVALVIPAPEGSITLHLERAEPWTEGGLAVLASTGDAAAPVSCVHYRGIIAGRPRSLAAISVFGEEVMGFVSDEDGDRVIGRIEGDDAHVFYREDHLRGRMDFVCRTSEVSGEDPAHVPTMEAGARSLKCVRLYWEVNHDIYLNKWGAANTISYVLGLFNQHATLLANDGVTVALSQLFIWDVPSPYVFSETSLQLNQFGTTRTSFNGDLAHLLGYGGSGGIAYLNTICNGAASNRMAYSSIYSSYQNVPTYSWSVNVVTHELGHNLGSPHTHSCAWNGNNTAIDGCGPAAGYGEGTCATGPLPPASVGGTIMSYCHLVSSGVNFANGFGPQPAALILGNVNNASCLASCPTPGCGIPASLTASNVFESSATVSWGAVSGAYAYQVRWQVPPSGPWSEAWSQATSITIGGLSPSSTYSFSVRAVCSGAVSGPYSSPGQFATLACTLGNPCDDGDMYTSNDRYVNGCACAGEPAPWTLIEKIVAADRAAGDQFGWTVDVDGDYAVVGARTDDQPINNAGSAYIFKRVGSSWTQQQKLLASDAEADDRFGEAVAIHGNYVVIGAHREDHDANGQNMLLNAGAVYVFVRNGDVWSQQQKIVAADRGSSDYFGSAVDIHGDRIVVGVSNDGQDASGGNTIDLAGSAYIFVRNGNVWSQEQKIVASDRAFWDSFGQSVAMSGDRIVVSAENEDEDANGSSTMANAGSAYVFARSGGAWNEEQKITAVDRAPGDLFGVSVDVDGDRLIVGAHYEDNLASDCGAAYIFSRTSGTWTQEQKIQASTQAEEDYFGRSVAIRGARALVGAYGKDAVSTGGGQVANGGAAYLFALVNGVWQQQFIALAPDRAVDDYFGVSVALGDAHFLVGAYSEDEDEFGMSTALSAGSGYFYAHPDHVVVAPRVMLKGPYSSATGLMSDALRTIGPLPLSGPYANMGYTHIGGGGEVATQATLTQSGADAVVDWVVVELRSSVDPTVRVATRTALVQRDGDVVSSNGFDPLWFPVPAGAYYLAIRHRNHLGVMTASPVALSSISTTIDFTNPATPTYGTNAQSNVSGTMVLWPGDVNFDGTVRYVGSNNDRDPILTAIGGSTPTNVVNNVYSPLDVNMDGVIKYVGANNDRDPILQAVGGSVPTATRLQQLP